MLNQGYGLPAAIGWPAQNAGHPVAALRGFRSVFCLLLGKQKKEVDSRATPKAEYPKTLPLGGGVAGGGGGREPSPPPHSPLWGEV